MPERYIPLSEDEQQFAALIEKVFTDEGFAKRMQVDPEKALEQAGYKLTRQQRSAISKSQTEERIEDVSLAGIPTVRPVVRVLTRGTTPAVRVVTKGTQPVVSVLVNTVFRVTESRSPMLEITPVKEKITKRKTSGRRKNQAQK